MYYFVNFLTNSEFENSISIFNIFIGKCDEMFQNFATANTFTKLKKQLDLVDFEKCWKNRT